MHWFGLNVVVFNVVYVSIYFKQNLELEIEKDLNNVIFCFFFRIQK